MRQEIARTRTVPQCHPFNSLYFEETKICRLRPYRNLGWSALLWAIRALFCLSCWFVSTSVTPIESFVACVQLLLLLLLPSWQCACLPDTTSAQGSTRPDLLQHYFSMSFFFLYHVRPLTPPCVLLALHESARLSISAGHKNEGGIPFGTVKTHRRYDYKGTADGCAEAA